MSHDIKWERVYTGSDLRATLLKNELEAIGIHAEVQSNKDAGLHAGFGPSGVSQVFVRAEDASKVLEIVDNFKEKME